MEIEHRITIKIPSKLEVYTTRISPDAQEQLYRMCCSGGRDFILFREAYLTELVKRRYCFESPITVQSLEEFHISELKAMLQTVNFRYPLPEKDKKKAILSWLTTGEHHLLEALQERYILLEFTKEAMEQVDKFTAIYLSRFKRKPQKHKRDTHLLFDKVTPFFYQDEVPQRTSNAPTEEVTEVPPPQKREEAENHQPPLELVHFLQLEQKIPLESDIVKKIQLCEECLPYIPDYMEHCMEEQYIPNVLHCRDTLLEHYMRSGEWDQANLTLNYLKIYNVFAHTKLDDEKGTVLVFEDGAKEITQFIQRQSVAKTVLHLLETYETLTQQQLVEHCKELSLEELKWFCQYSLEIKRVQQGSEVVLATS